MAKKKSQKAQNKASQALQRPLENTLAKVGNPFSLMKRFSEEMDRLFGDFGLGRGLVPPALMNVACANWSPQVEMFERDGELVVRADLPGLKKDDVKVEFTDDGLAIEGERRAEREEKGEGYYRSERSYGNFYRLLPLPDGVNPEDASAKFQNGVLEVTMPARKKMTRAKKKIEISEASAPKSRAKAA